MKKLYLLAINKLLDVYSGNCKDYYSTEWNTYLEYYNNEHLQILAIAGTNDPWDWFWNLCMLSQDGVKKGAYIASKRILKSFKRIPGIPLLICCHSKSGPTGMYLGKLLRAEYCIAFAPDAGFKEEVYLPNTTIFWDKDDLVPELGQIFFHHPECKIIYLPRNKKWWDLPGRIFDHSLIHMKDFILKMKGEV